MLHVIESGTATHDEGINGLPCLDPFGMGDSANGSRTLFQGPDHFLRRHHRLPLGGRSSGYQGLLEVLLLRLEPLKTLHIQCLELTTEPLQCIPCLLVRGALHRLESGQHLPDQGTDKRSCFLSFSKKRHLCLRVLNLASPKRWRNS